MSEGQLETVKDEEQSEVRRQLGRIQLTATRTAKGHKSSEGDGRTAADIRRELAEKE